MFQHFLDMSSYLNLLSHELKESGCAKHTKPGAELLAIFAKQKIYKVCIDIASAGQGKVLCVYKHWGPFPTKE